MIQKNIRPELLAPAGHWESLKAAASNGADAVYFGLREFNARRRAENFEASELAEIVEFLHRRNIRAYLALNTLVFSSELFQVQELILAGAEAGIDAVIVQDLGLASLVHQLVPTLPIHASTQMTLTEPVSMGWVKKFGIRRIILPRELSLQEIKSIAQNTDLELEVFVHGALCVSYSGQCLASESLGGRSANRGLCAQACRLPYQILADGLPLDEGRPACRLSPMDLALYDRIHELVELGVKGFKIEGRLKDSVYVASTTRIYRASLDAAMSKKSFALTREQNLQLAQSFSRGFTHGFFDGFAPRDFIHKEISKNSGVRLGIVAGKTDRGIVVALGKIPEKEIQNHVKPGDGIVFDEETNHPQGGRVFEVHVIRGFLGPRTPFKTFCELVFEKGKIDPTKILKGVVVRKTDDPLIKKQIQQTYVHEGDYQKLSLIMKIRASLNKRLRITVKDGDGCLVEIEGDEPLQAALRHPATYEVIYEQLSRLGNTPFQLAYLEIEALDSVMIPKSVLNNMRRRIIDLISEKHFSKFKHAVSLENRYRPMTQNFSQEVSGNPSDDHLYILVRTLSQLKNILAWNPRKPIRKPSLIYCDFQDLHACCEAVSIGRSAGVKIGWATPRILKLSEGDFLKTISQCRPDAFLVRNLGSLQYFRVHDPDIPRIGDFSLNTANEITAGLLLKEGFLRLVPSFDLRWEELKDMLRFQSPHVFEVVVHQHVPMFHTQYCFFCDYFKTEPGQCSKSCFQHHIALKDRKEIVHPILADAGCRNTVFNGRPQSAIEWIGEMKKTGIRNFRLDFLNENAEEIHFLLECYGKVIFGENEGESSWDGLRAFQATRGTWT